MSYIPEHASAIPPSAIGGPTWEIALLHPPQGSWSESEYLRVADSNRMVELVDGRLEVLPMPTMVHQLIAKFLLFALDRFVQERQIGGHVLFAPMPVHLGEDHYREPDVVYLRSGRTINDRGQPEGADLAVEVVSAGREARKRDFVEKPRDYAAAGVAEYWIVDPDERTIQVLALEGDAYCVHGLFKDGDTATSVLLDGFAVAVSDVFNVS
jgi:Uma2 family endonuclease